MKYSEEVRRQSSERMKALWADPQWRAVQIARRKNQRLHISALDRRRRAETLREGQKKRWINHWTCPPEYRKLYYKLRDALGVETARAELSKYLVTLDRAGE